MTEIPLGKEGDLVKKKAPWAVCLLLAACLLTGCARLLERSYHSVRPYADRYWDSSAEDTLRVDSYQDLVNSLMMLVEQRAEEGIIRCYGETGEYKEAMAAREEVRRETTLGSYLLRDLRITYESGASYSTATCSMSYREDAEDVASIMTLSDSQSLVDLLRLTVREEREKLTARFSYDMPRGDVSAAVESFWQELCRAEMEAQAAEAAEAAGQAPPEELADGGPDASRESGEEPPPADGAEEAAEPSEGEEPPAAPDSGEEAPAEQPDGSGEDPQEPEEDPIEYPPCPWQIRFYPNKETAEIVEVLLKRK